MSTAKKRSYTSDLRGQQAAQTRMRILEAALEVFQSQGFDGATLDAIARSAAVSVATVFGHFKSKRGVLLALVDQARFDEGYRQLVLQARDEPDPRRRLDFSARICRQIYQAEQATLELVRGAATVSPELASLINEQEAGRRVPQLALIKELQAAGALREGLTAQRAADVMWTLTSRETFRALVTACGWSHAAYESWLRACLRRELCAE